MIAMSIQSVLLLANGAVILGALGTGEPIQMPGEDDEPEFGKRKGVVRGL
jgi:hypothetical protein